MLALTDTAIRERVPLPSTNWGSRMRVQAGPAGADLLREVEGLSTLETSEILQLSSEAVRVRFHRGRLALRRQGEKQV